MTSDAAGIGQRYREVCERMATAAQAANRPEDDVELVAVTKTKTAGDIEPVLDLGHRVFGENRVQEAQSKWPALREAYSGIELHLIGPLQSNKAELAVELFDVIETIDREKIARAVSAAMQSQKRSLEVYVQVNTGLEPQKAGIAPKETVEFVSWCCHELGLNVRGLMCIPPVDDNAGPHFALLRKLAAKAKKPALSMGMSGDFELGIAFGATSVRVGSAIFGAR